MKLTFLQKMTDAKKSKCSEQPSVFFAEIEYRNGGLVFNVNKNFIDFIRPVFNRNKNEKKKFLQEREYLDSFVDMFAKEFDVLNVKFLSHLLSSPKSCPHLTTQNKNLKDFFDFRKSSIESFLNILHMAAENKECRSIFEIIDRMLIASDLSVDQYFLLLSDLLDESMNEEILKYIKKTVLKILDKLKLSIPENFKSEEEKLKFFPLETEDFIRNFEKEIAIDFFANKKFNGQQITNTTAAYVSNIYLLELIKIKFLQVHFSSELSSKQKNDLHDALDVVFSLFIQVYCMVFFYPYDSHSHTWISSDFLWNFINKPTLTLFISDIIDYFINPLRSQLNDNIYELVETLTQIPDYFMSLQNIKLHYFKPSSFYYFFEQTKEYVLGITKHEQPLLLCAFPIVLLDPCWFNDLDKTSVSIEYMFFEDNEDADKINKNFKNLIEEYLTHLDGIARKIKNEFGSSQGWHLLHLSFEKLNQKYANVISLSDEQKYVKDKVEKFCEELWKKINEVSVVFPSNSIPNTLFKYLMDAKNFNTPIKDEMLTEQDKEKTVEKSKEKIAEEKNELFKIMQLAYLAQQFPEANNYVKQLMGLGFQSDLQTLETPTAVEEFLLNFLKLAMNANFNKISPLLGHEPLSLESSNNSNVNVNFNAHVNPSVHEVYNAHGKRPADTFLNSNNKDEIPSSGVFGQKFDSSSLFAQTANINVPNEHLISERESNAPSFSKKQKTD